MFDNDNAQYSQLKDMIILQSTFQIVVHFFVLFLDKKKETHIKKPLNAFMLYMKEMRPVVQAECTLKESAAINQLLGRRVSVRQQVIADDLYVLMTD